MKRLVLIAAVGLAGCNPPADTTPGTFEPFAASLIADAECRYFPVDGDEAQLLFATYPDNADFLAVAMFKGETIKLVPKEPQPMDTDSFDITYEVIDYLKWQVRATSDGGVGTLQLIQNETPLGEPVAMRGGCEA